MGLRDRRERASTNSFGFINKNRVAPIDIFVAVSGDNTPPLLSNISSGTPNATDATITWITNELADSRVLWGLTTAYAGVSSPINDFTYVTSHSVQITGLTTATLYHYKIVSKDTSNNYQSSVDGTFTTA